MLRYEALKEAQRRWGRYGKAYEAGHEFLVGILPPRPRGTDWRTFFQVKGKGLSWEAAFDEADRNHVRNQINHPASGTSSQMDEM